MYQTFIIWYYNITCTFEILKPNTQNQPHTRARSALTVRHLHQVWYYSVRLDLAGAAQRAERPRDPGGVAAFMSAHSKTPYINPSMEFSSGEGVIRGRRVQQLTFTLRRDV